MLILHQQFLWREFSFPEFACIFHISRYALWKKKCSVSKSNIRHYVCGNICELFFFFFNSIYYCSSLWIQSHVILKTLLLHILVRLHTLSFASIFRKLHLKITLAGAQQETLQCKEDSLEQGHLDKHYIYNTCKKNPVKLILGVFSCRYSWNYCILNKKLNHTIKTVFPKSGHIFSISRKRQRRPSPHHHRSSCVSVG